MQGLTHELQYSEACERNKGPVLEVLRATIKGAERVLEIGSGTGQHAVYFAAALPEIHWQPSDTGEYLPALRARLTQEAPGNVAGAINIDVRMEPWPFDSCDVLFSANTLHFMGPDCVADFFRGAGQVLESGGRLIVYGPFNYGGEYTSSSNARFDEWLASTDPERAIRNFEWVNELAAAQGLELVHDHSMPANNRALVWCRGTNV